MSADVGSRLELLDWRRRIAELYAMVRADPEPAHAWEVWCATRRRLFMEHPQSPLPPAERNAEHTPRYFPYDPSLRMEAAVTASAGGATPVPYSTGGEGSLVHAGSAHLAMHGMDADIDLLWLDDYAGGLLLMCRDATSGSETYGAGRYVLDTAKGADLGGGDGSIVVDFNFAYQPSCAYDPSWSCPLPPRANWLTIPIHAGERLAPT